MTDRGLKPRKGYTVYSTVQVTTEEYEQAYHELFAPEPTPCDSHDPIDNGTKTSECRHCRQRMVFDYPEWRVCK